MRYEKETIKCWCGWDSGIPRVNLMVIHKDIICPKCGAVVIHSRYPDQPKRDDTWIPEKPRFPIKKKKWDEPNLRHALMVSVFKRLENSAYV